MNNHEMNYREQEGNSLKDYINLIKINIIPILLISAAGLIVSVLYALTAQNIYKSTTVMKLSKPQGSILEAPLMPEFQDFGSDRFIANEIEIMKSYTIREKVAKSLIDTFHNIGVRDSFYWVLNQDLDLTPDSEVKTVVQLSELLSKIAVIEQKRGLDILEISVESPSSFEAALIANSYAEAYKQQNLTYNRLQLITVKNFLEEQRVDKLNELREAEDAVKKYQEQGGIVVLDEQARALIDLISEFESQLNAAKIEMMSSELTLKLYNEELDRQNPEIKKYIENFAAQKELEQYQTSIAKLTVDKELAMANLNRTNKEQEIAKYYDDKIADLNKKVDKLLEKYEASIFASSPEEIKELTLKKLEEEVKYNAYKASYNELDKIVKNYERRFNQLPERTIDLARLQREREAYEKLYLLVEEKYQEALINEQSTPGNVIIVDQARRATKPSKPNRMLIVLVGIVLGTGMGLGFAFVRNYFDSTVKTPEDIQNKNINLLTWIPEIEGVGSEDHKEFEFIVAKRPDSIPSEAFRALRTRIQFSKIRPDALKTILVTSSTPKEGKTTVSVNLAGSFAYTNKRTVVVDCDLRKPRMHNVFKAQRFPGFTDYFFGQAEYEEIVRTSEIENLDFITAGTIPPNPSEILGSPQMEKFLEKLKSLYDVVILDSPPVIAVTDSEILSRMVDATVLIASANITENDLLEKSVELLTHDHGSFIGVVLNRFMYRSGYGSYYKYYYYYSRPDQKNKKPKAELKS
ncbi:MAG: polysaccharide biosynthesis tyrosine autokinase [Melioribacteraceae bacterium]|nr:polysaccharide biosynthesis tyrosine autokinase [Melioribacteraceae bacterium]